MRNNPLSSSTVLPEPDRPRLVSWPKAQLQIHLQINLFSPDPLFWKVTVSGIAQPTLEGNERVLPCGSDRRWLGGWSLVTLVRSTLGPHPAIGRSIGRPSESLEEGWETRCLLE